MADKTGKKIVSITIKRERVGLPKVVVASGFKLRSDKASGLIDILVESGKRAERISFDPILMRGNLDNFKQYATGLATEPDDAAAKEEINVGEGGCFSNILHVSQMGGRAETIFGNFCISDWVQATRRSEGGTPEVASMDVVAVMSSTGFQKKLLLDLIIFVHEGTKE